MAVVTPAYVSPEQATASDDIDGRTDIYSLGCVLYQMLAGTPPYMGSTPQAVLARHVSPDMAPGIRTVRTTISEPLEGVVRKAMAKVPADRFATAAELRDLLGQPDTYELPAKSTGSKRPIWMAAAAVVLVVGGFLGWNATRGDTGSLRTNQIVVYPLVTPELAAADATAGEDIAIIVGHTVDGTGALRWVDGWTLLTDEQRGRMRGVSAETEQRLARAQGSARYLTGSVFVYADSVQVLLALHDVAGDSILARSAESVPLETEGTWREEAIRAGLLAVNGLLPALIPVGSPDVVDEWRDRNPAAIADFLAAEQLFRRARSTEALVFYRKSIATDPQFSLAAVRGSQAAIWAHELEAVAELVQPILDRPEGVPPEYLHFANGLAAFANGAADEAVRQLREAVTLDPEFGEAWMQLGETYTHLLPNEPNPDSLANQAFARAFALDPSGTNVLFHLIQQAVRTGDTAGASEMAEAFLRADPDPQLAREVDIMVSCGAGGPDAVDWATVSREAPAAALHTAKAFGWAVVPCSEAANRAALASGDFRWFSEVGLVTMHLLQGRDDRARHIIDSIMVADSAGSSLYLVAAAFGAGALQTEVRVRAQEILARERARHGERYQRLALPYLLWEIGVLEARLGNVAAARDVRNTLTGLAGQDDGDPRLAGMLATAMAAHVAVAESDTAGAIDLLQSLVPTGNKNQLAWNEEESLGPERLLLAELLLSQGRFEEARAVAARFDTSLPLIYPLYLPA
ncbi:MAG: protein kinase family protein, partial [Gemmatimonadales bacterium]